MIHQLSKTVLIPRIRQRLWRSDTNPTTIGHHRRNWQNSSNNGPVTDRYEKEHGVLKRTTEVDPDQKKLWLTSSVTQDSPGPLVILSENLTDTQINSVIEDAKKTYSHLNNTSKILDVESINCLFSGLGKHLSIQLPRANCQIQFDKNKSSMILDEVDANETNSISKRHTTNEILIQGLLATNCKNAVVRYSINVSSKL